MACRLLRKFLELCRQLNNYLKKLLAQVGSLVGAVPVFQPKADEPLAQNSFQENNSEFTKFD